MERQDLYDAVRAFFDGLEGARLKDLIREHIRDVDRVIQFDPSDAEPFYVQIQLGKIALGKGKKCPPDFVGGLYIQGDQHTLRSLSEGEVSLAEAIYQHKIRIPGYRNREPVMVWFSKLLRLGLGIRD